MPPATGNLGNTDHKPTPGRTVSLLQQRISLARVRVSIISDIIRLKFCASVPLDGYWYTSNTTHLEDEKSVRLLLPVAGADESDDVLVVYALQHVQLHLPRVV